MIFDQLNLRIQISFTRIKKKQQKTLKFSLGAKLCPRGILVCTYISLPDAPVRTVTAQGEDKVKWFLESINEERDILQNILKESEITK